MMLRIAFLNAFLFTSLMILINGCSSEKEVIGYWTDQKVAVDSETSAWQNDLQFLTDENVAVGFKNDDKFLYMCFATNDLSKVFPMFRSGFIVWFEPDKGGKTIGIKFPIHNINNNDQGPIPNQISEGENRGEFINQILSRQNEMQILNEDKYPLADLTLGNKEGIEAKLAYNSDRFIYQLKVPLKSKKFSYSIDAAPGDQIKIKFETEKAERKNFSGEEGMRPGGNGGERPGFGGEGPHGGFRPRMRNGQRSFEPINFYVKLTLKTSNNSINN